MPGFQSRRLRKQRDREMYFQSQQAKYQEMESHLAENLTPEEAFRLVTCRVEWLNDKIALCKANGLRFGLYIREREALFWMMDKIKELSEKLLKKEN